MSTTTVRIIGDSPFAQPIRRRHRCHICNCRRVALNGVSSTRLLFRCIPRARINTWASFIWFGFWLFQKMVVNSEHAPCQRMLSIQNIWYSSKYLVLRILAQGEPTPPEFYISGLTILRYWVMGTMMGSRILNKLYTFI